MKLDKRTVNDLLPIANSDISYYTKQTLTKGDFVVTNDAYPKAVLKNSRGEELGQLQLRLDREMYTLSEEEKTTFHQQMMECIKRMSPATADAFDIVMSHWAKHANTLTSRVALNVDDILEYRGILKNLSGDKIRGGYLSEQREAVARQLQTLAYTYVEAQGTGYDAKKKPKDLKVRCPIIVITGEYSVQDAVTKHTEFIKITYCLGDYFAGVMLGNKKEGIPRQVAYLPSPVVQLDPYRQGYIRNLGGYLTYLWKNRYGKGSYCDPIKVKTLIRGMGIDTNKMRPWRIRERLETALDFLEEHNVIREWKYPWDFNSDDLPKRGWLQKWLDIAVEIEPAANILDQYAEIKQPKAKDEKRQEPDDLIQQLREKRKAGGLSMNQLAEQIGINVSTLSRLESGKTKPRGKTKTKIEKWLDN